LKTLIVVSSRADWPFVLQGVEVIDARRYLLDPMYAGARGLRVYNLCGTYRYQSAGYYVSLLAAARGHKPVPSVTTIQDLKSAEIVRVRSDELDELVQRSLKPLVGDEFTLSIYFGQNLAARYARLSKHLFGLFHAPFLRARFQRSAERWQLRRVSPIPAGDIPTTHRGFVLSAATEYFAAPPKPTKPGPSALYDLAVLVQPDDHEPPSDERALKRFVRAAQKLGMECEFVGRDDYARIAEFDALFIRETTNVNHHTYRFARRAHAEGLAVIDDPESILKCSNKIYLAELLQRHDVPTPKTVVVGRDSAERIRSELSFPCVLKEPDSAFSLGVMKVKTEEELQQALTRLLDKSELVVAQEFTPTDFDWRIGVLDGQPLYACRYFMAKSHWQIIKSVSSGRRVNGRVDAVPLQAAPQRVVRAALRAAALIGNGLYGVDLKEVGRRVLIVEINDNPSIEAGYEDRAEGPVIYERIMQSLLSRIRESRGGAPT
jgi:glutathione synthase/RimK-type ligase-like ATP-grasp enzyme